jgi:hypothetical protein
VAPVPAVAPWPSAVPPRRVDVLRVEQSRLDPWVPAAVWTYVVVGLVGAVAVGKTTALIRDEWHWFHRAFRAIHLHQAQLPPQPKIPWWFTLSSLVSFAALAAEILFFVWQFRAASTARELGYRSRHSPGWGVGCWFVPVVNLWMPYQAVRDCLPAVHPGARRVLWSWLLLLATMLLGGASTIAAPSSTGVAVTLALVGVALRIPLGFLGTRVVRDIAADHRQPNAAHAPT